MHPALRSFPLPFGILGAGISGTSVQKLLLSCGVPPEQIFLYDDKKPVSSLDRGTFLRTITGGTLVVSPGVPLKTPWIQSALTSGCHLSSELSIAFRFLENEKVVAVTGSIGKSTCVSLIGAALKAESPNNFFGGNLGQPLADYALSVLRGRARAEFIALELSSYQLENLVAPAFVSSVITWLSPNHLERYDDLDHYYSTKWSLVKRTLGPVFLNGHCPDLREYASKHPADNLSFVLADPKQESFDSFSLLGEHNRQNIALALALVRYLKLGPAAESGMQTFGGLPHRLENLGTFRGITFINDSKSTSVDSVLSAVKSCQHSKGHLHLLLGGRDKGLPWEKLSSLSQMANLKVSFFGESGPMIKTKSRLDGLVYAKLDDCLKSLTSALIMGDVVLLSPGGTSHDEFTNFEQRGDFFRSWVINNFSKIGG